MIRPDELIVDNFAGGGGASTAIEQALGRPVDIAINHNPEAIAMHRANHPRTRHLCENVWAVDPVAVCAGRPVGLAWFSPDCKDFSKAKGGKPVSKNIRGLAWVALKWAERVRPRIIIVENVEEFQQWSPLLENKFRDPNRKGETFRRWLSRFAALRYRYHFGELKAHQHGAPTIRKRLFIVLRCDGLDPKEFWPEPTHGPGLLPYRTAAECIDWTLPCPSIFLSREEGRAIGVNRPLADATMRRIARGVKRYVLDASEPFIVRTAHSDVGPNSKRWGKSDHSLREPLPTVTGSPDFAVVNPDFAALPIIPVQVGEWICDDCGRKFPALGDINPENPRVQLDGWMLLAADCPYCGGGAHEVSYPSSLVTPFVVNSSHGGKVEGIEDPISTIATEKGGCRALVTPFLASLTHHGENRTEDVAEPFKTTENRHAVVAAFLAKHFGGVVGSDLNDPTATVTSKDHNALVASYLSKMRGTNIGSASDEPLHTLSAGGTHHAEVRAFLMKYYGTDGDARLEDPLHTVPTKDRFGLVMVEGEEYAIVDIGMRMLAPRELFRAQGFPDSYIISYGIDENGKKVPFTKTAQVRLCGNSVSPPPAMALIRAQLGARSSEAAA